MKLRAALKILPRLTYYRLLFTRHTAALVSFLAMLAGYALARVDRVRAAGLLMLSHRNAFSVKKQVRRERLLHKYRMFDDDVIDALLPPYDEREPEDKFRERILKIKEPSGDEKGVLIMKFLDAFVRLRQEYDMERMLQDYFLVLEMSYYGCCAPELLQYLRYAPQIVTVGAVQELEVAFLNRMNNNLRQVGFNSATWTDDRVFHRDEKIAKEFDSVMVGTWDPIKRHNILLEAIAQLDDPHYHAALVGAEWGGTRAQIEALVEYYGVSRNVSIIQGLQHEGVNEVLNKSKVKALMSLKEGGNKAIIESMFAGTPILLLSEHIGIDRNWINSQTGRLVDRADLPEALRHFQTEWQSYAPHIWARDNISCRQSTQKLEKVLKRASEELGLPWTRSLVVKFNHGWRPKYYDPEEALSPLDWEHYRRRPSHVQSG